MGKNDSGTAGGVSAHGEWEDMVGLQEVSVHTGEWEDMVCRQKMKQDWSDFGVLCSNLPGECVLDRVTCTGSAAEE